MGTRYATILRAIIVAMAVTSMVQAAWAAWWPFEKGTSAAPEAVKVEITHPTNGDVDRLDASTSSVQLKLVARVMKGDKDITDQAQAFKWTLQHEWHSQSHHYASPTITQEGPENPRWVTVDWYYGAYPEGTGNCEGRIKVFAKAQVRGKWYSASKHAIQLVAGTNPPASLISGLFGQDVRMKAVAYKESTYRQFFESGAPCRNSYAWGLTQINEHPRAWGDYGNFNWLSLAWDCGWNAYEGAWIHNVHLPSKLTQAQQSWTAAQRKDACTYGYNQGEGAMRRATWETIDGFGYVNTVRGFESSQPWGQ